MKTKIAKNRFISIFALHLKNLKNLKRPGKSFDTPAYAALRQARQGKVHRAFHSTIKIKMNG